MKTETGIVGVYIATPNDHNARSLWTMFMQQPPNYDYNEISLKTSSVKVDMTSS